MDCYDCDLMLQDLGAPISIGGTYSNRAHFRMGNAASGNGNIFGLVDLASGAITIAPQMHGQAHFRGGNMASGNGNTFFRI